MTKYSQRPKGTGSIYRNKRGQWVAVIEAGWSASGTRRRLTAKAQTRAGARARLLELRSRVESNSVPTGNGLSVKVWADRWLAARAQRVRPGTFVADRSAVTKWIVPAIGHRRLDALTPSDVRAVMELQEAAGRATLSMQRTHAVFTKLLTDAVAEGHQVPQRARETAGPGSGFSTRQALSPDDAARILQVAANRPDSSRWVAALVQGLRPAEALGLTWSMVDLDAATITLAWQLKSLPYRVPRNEDSGFLVPRDFEARLLMGAFHLVRPKTRAGFRVIPIVPHLLEELVRWEQESPRCDHDLVWPHHGGGPCPAEYDRQQWYRIVEEAGVTVTMPNGTERRPLLYEARHTAATLLLANNVDDTTIKAILGHSTIVSSRAYLHADLSRTRYALEASARLLGLGASAASAERLS